MTTLLIKQIPFIEKNAYSEQCHLAMLDKRESFVTCYMMETSTRMKDYRARLRRQGLRPVQIWLPDQRTAGFREELKRQIETLDRKDEDKALRFIEQSVDWPTE